MPRQRRKVGKKTKKGGITPRKRRFIDYYIELDNATQAAIKAGYSKNGAGQTANNLLKTTEIQQAIEERRKEIAEKADIRAQDVINEFAKIAFANPEDFFEWEESIIETSQGEQKIVSKILIKTPEQIDRDKKAAIASIKETAQGGLEFKFHDKIKALENLSKYFGNFTDADIDKARRMKKLDQPTEQHDPTENLSEADVDKLLDEIDE